MRQGHKLGQHRVMGGVQQEQCHPFIVGRLAGMVVGHLGLLQSVPRMVRGHTVRPELLASVAYRDLETHQTVIMDPRTNVGIGPDGPTFTGNRPADRLPAERRSAENQDQTAVPRSGPFQDQKSVATVWTRVPVKMGPQGSQGPGTGSPRTPTYPFGEGPPGSLLPPILLPYAFEMRYEPERIFGIVHAESGKSALRSGCWP